MTATPDIAAIARGLTKAQRDDITVHWDELSDADPMSNGRDYDDCVNDLEANGFAVLVPVDDEALEDSFAAERGIVPDGLMFILTPLGLTLKAHLEQSNA